MNTLIIKNILPITAIFSFRMFGLFMLLPVFTLYAYDLKDAQPFLIGIALGGYGLSQGLLQIPFGMLSDIFGRKLLISIGLILFIIGSILGAMADSIYLMIAARIIQGTGAIGSTLIALMADLTPVEERTKAMAFIGGGIGISFGLSMIISPIITKYLGLPGIFYLTTILATLGLVILHTIIPDAEEIILDKKKPSLFEILNNQELLKLNISIFMQHLLFTETFFVIPLLLKKFISLNTLTQDWHFYLPILVLSFVAILPIIIIGEKKHQVKQTFLLAIVLTLISQSALFFLHANWIAFIILMFLYFASFNLLEALIPSIVSRVVAPENKGSAMGVYSSFQFLGIFTGGVLAGIIYQFFNITGIFAINCILSTLWIFCVFKIKCDIYPTKQADS